MAQADKSKFLSKLARFVANPTTDWAALDAAKAGQPPGQAPGGEGLELTRAEILAIRHQRRKDNRNIRIKEFAMLRQVRAGASASNAHSMVSTHSKQLASSKPAEVVGTTEAVDAVDAAEAAKVAAIQKHTLIANFSDKINRIEQQMAEQWWDSVDKTKPLHTQIPIQREVPKTQMLIETRIAQFDMPDEVQDSDVIEFDPAMLEGLPVQPVTQSPQPGATVHPAHAIPPQRAEYAPVPAAAPQQTVAPAAPVQKTMQPAPAMPQAAPAAVAPQSVQHLPQQAPVGAHLAHGVPEHGSASAHSAQAMGQPVVPASMPVAPVAPAASVAPAPVMPAHSVAAPVSAVPASIVAPAPTVPVAPVAPAVSVAPAPVMPAHPEAASVPAVPAAPAQAAPIATPAAHVAPQPSAATASEQPASPAVPKAATSVRSGAYVPASPVHGSGEQVDFSADQPSARAASTFVYRDAFTEVPPEAHDSSTSDGVLAEGELPQHPLPEADSRSMAEAQAKLYGENALHPNIVIPPEYTPADLPECLNEPAILFVQGQLEQAEEQLLELARAEQLRAQMGQHQNEEPHVLLALLDFYRCTEQEDKFEAASIEMVRYFDRSAPQYQGADLGEASRILSTLGSFADIDYSIQNGWRCPAELDLTDVMLLRAQLMTQPPQVLLDWQLLQTILDDAVEPLLDQFRDLAGRKVDLLMWGGEQLLACCVRKIEEQNGVASSLLSLLWLLRLELERIMHGQEVFDQVALEYCMALEESPPSWVRTRCHFIDADNALSMLDGDKQPDSALVHATNLSKDEEVTLKHPMQWKGTFHGNIQALLQAVSTECQGEFCVIDCSQFNGMDYPAAVALLEWLMEPQNAQRRIQFVQVNRLVAVFWRVMGITAQATVKLRRD